MVFTRAAHPDAPPPPPASQSTPALNPRIQAAREMMAAKTAHHTSVKMAAAPELLPVRTIIHVEAPLSRAFEVFVADIGRWWPLGYTYAEDTFDTAAIECWRGGRWFERDKGGHETAWGAVRAYAPPDRIVLSFAVSPQRMPEPPERASEVEVRFFAEPENGTRVEVEHRDFAKHGAGAAQLRDGMASRQGWPTILASYARMLRGG